MKKQETASWSKSFNSAVLLINICECRCFAATTLSENIATHSEHNHCLQNEEELGVGTLLSFFLRFIDELYRHSGLESAGTSSVVGKFQLNSGRKCYLDMCLMSFNTHGLAFRLFSGNHLY